MLFKNAASQGVYLFAFDSINNVPKAGDAGNLTGSISKDGGAPVSIATAHPVEIGGGVYWQPLAQAESNANAVALVWSSTTAGVQVDPVIALTNAGAIPMAAPAAPGGLPTVGVGAGQISPAGGALNAGNLPAFPANFAGLAISSGGAVKVAPDGLDAVAIEAGINARQALSAILASAAGALSGAATNTITIQGGNSAAARITAMVDADGNRSAVTLNLPQ